MPAPITRPATAADAAHPAFDGLLPDRWREGDNRRSLVAADEAGTPLGHCRAIDNVFHPASRSLVLEIRPGAPAPHHERRSHRDGPPHRELRHRCRGERAARADAGPLRRALHRPARPLVPAAAPEQLRAENAPDFTPGGDGSFDPSLTTLLIRDDRIVAQALAWPPQPDGGTEITIQSRPHEGPTARENMEACLAAAIDRSADGDQLLIDSHVSEELESAMMRDLPGPALHPEDTWTAIVAIPVPGGPAPIPLPADRIPADAAALVSRLRGSAEEIEDADDVRAVDEAMAEEGQNIPWEQVTRDLE